MLPAGLCCDQDGDGDESDLLVMLLEEPEGSFAAQPWSGLRSPPAAFVPEQRLAAQGAAQAPVGHSFGGWALLQAGPATGCGQQQLLWGSVEPCGVADEGSWLY
jgi:hypothetical protein